MAQWCAACEVEIWAYCLMPNHVHLIAAPRSEGRASQSDRRGAPPLHPPRQFSRGMAGLSLAGPLRVLRSGRRIPALRSALHRAEPRASRAGGESRGLAVEQRPRALGANRRPVNAARHASGARGGFRRVACPCPIRPKRRKRYAATNEPVVPWGESISSNAWKAHCVALCAPKDRGEKARRTGNRYCVPGLR